MNKIRVSAIVYDLGDIFFEAHLWRKWMHRSLKRNGVFRGSFHEFYNLYDSFHSSSYTGRVAYLKNLVRFLQYVGLSKDDSFLTKALEMKSTFEANRKLYPGIRRTLKTLTSLGIKNIVFSDNEFSGRYVKERILRRFDLNQFLSSVVTSKDIGVSKSSARGFRLLIRHERLIPRATVFVGHDVDELQSARKANLTTVEFNNYHRIHTNADFRISRFADLIQVLDLPSRAMVKTAS